MKSIIIAGFAAAFMLSGCVNTKPTQPSIAKTQVADKSKEYVSLEKEAAAFCKKQGNKKAIQEKLTLDGQTSSHMVTTEKYVCV